MHGLWVLFKCELLYWRVYPLSLVNITVSHFLGIAPFLFAAKLFGDCQDFQIFIAVGLILWYWLGTLFWGIGYGVRDSIDEGVLESIAASPTSLHSLLIAKALNCLLQNIFVTATMLLWLWLLLGVRLEPHWGKFFLILALSGVALSGLAMIYAAFVIRVKQAASIGNTVHEALGLLSGMTFPVHILPAGVRVLSSLIPLTYAIQGARNAVLGECIVLEAMMLVLFAVITVPLGWYLVSAADRKLRRSGTWGEY
ncbi:MAG: hypothetical protein DDT29_01091 [Dehalococcoidia bacterium]|nr:hypothetical protein [Bacillota bacterium]